MTVWQESGTGPALVLLHGISSGSASWHKQLNDPRLQRCCRILAWDAPGYGGSAPLAAEKPTAACYAGALARMLDAGEDPLYLGRRLVRMAVEDIGLADPQALVICNAAKDAYDYLGSPEGELALAQACVYLATAPKSNAVYTAYKSAMRAAKENGSLLPPKHILNAPTKLMKGEGYGDGYRYDHDEPDAFSGQDYFPEKMGRQTYYDPPERGFERDIRKRLDWWSKLRKERGGS